MAGAENTADGGQCSLHEVEGVHAKVLARAVRPGAERVERVRLCDVRIRAAPHLGGHEDLWVPRTEVANRAL